MSDKPKFDYVNSVQEAINMAAAENRVVRFIWNKSNAEIRKSYQDKKGCKLLKRDKTSNEIAIVPPSIENFTFEEEVDTRIILTDRNLIIP